MKKRLSVNFISLFDVIEKVALQISISNDEVEYYRDKRNDSTEFLVTLSRWPIKNLFRRSRAAFKLISCLSNGSGSGQLGWYDEAALGIPLRNDNLKPEGLAELINWARWEREFTEKFERNAKFTQWRDRAPEPKISTVWPTINLIESPDVGVPTIGQVEVPNNLTLVPDQSELPADLVPILNPPKIPRLLQIGFDRDELIGFLNANDVLHSFGEISSTSNVVPTYDALSLPTLENKSVTEAIHAQTIVDDNGPNFRGPLSEVLYLALKNATNKNRYQSVFAALVDIARQEKPPYPIVEFIAAENAIKWNDEVDEESPYKFFNKEDMRTRFRFLKSPKKRT